MCNVPKFYNNQDISINIYVLEEIFNDNVTATESVTTNSKNASIYSLNSLVKVLLHCH